MGSLRVRVHPSTAALAAILLAACGPSEQPAASDADAAATPAAPPVTPAPVQRFAAVDGARIVSAEASEPGQWLTAGRDYGEERFSPLDAITPANVGELGLAWFVDLDTNRGQEATPIVVDGVLYVSTAWSKVKAYDAATGEELWAYDPEVPFEWAGSGCCDVVNRGVAAWEGKIYVGTYDGRLVALDAETGEEIFDVNTIDREWPYSITGAPRIVKGLVIIGNGGAELGVRGYVTAYDAETGEQAWRFHTVPGNPADGFESAAMETAASTWNGEWWVLGGGGTVWDGMAYDPDLDLLYIGVGNGSPWNQALRSPGGGDNLFLSSIVALDPDTGAYVWHYQESPGETWDYTATQPIIVTDLVIDGLNRRVLLHAPKNGFFYVIDAGSGELLSATPFMPQNWTTGVDMTTGRPIPVEAARFDKTGLPAMVMPGPQGAHSWHPMSYSPETGYVYLPASESGYVFSSPEDFTPVQGGVNTGMGFATPEQREGLEPAPPFRSFTMAWDPVHKAEVWRSEFRPGPGAGTLATGGGLVFAGGAETDLVAFDAATGEKLWSVPTQTPVVAAAASYAVEGEQHVAVLAGYGPGGYGRSNNSRLLVFALGGTAALPPAPPAPPPPVLDPPEQTASAETIAHGEEVFRTRCQLCHEPPAANRNLFPDLRYSLALGDADLFESIVLGGLLQANGMAPFDAVLDPPDAEALRAYLVGRAHQLKAQQAAAAAAAPPPPRN
jgi:PQQ-dependent dehydrogenase (methanol/ethanol family)